DYVDRAILGRYDQWFVDITRRLGQSTWRASIKIYGCSLDMLWNGYIRRTNVIAKTSECDCALHRLDRSSRTRWRIGLEWFYDVRGSILVIATYLQNRIVF